MVPVYVTVSELQAVLNESDMAYYDQYSKEDEARVKGVWLKGHQDHGGTIWSGSAARLTL